MRQSVTELWFMAHPCNMWDNYYQLKVLKPVKTLETALVWDDPKTIPGQLYQIWSSIFSQCQAGWTCIPRLLFAKSSAVNWFFPIKFNLRRALIERPDLGWSITQYNNCYTKYILLWFFYAQSNIKNVNVT